MGRAVGRAVFADRKSSSTKSGVAKLYLPIPNSPLPFGTLYYDRVFVCPLLKKILQL